MRLLKATFAGCLYLLAITAATTITLTQKLWEGSHSWVSIKRSSST